jgi:hypothetical protein
MKLETKRDRKGIALKIAGMRIIRNVGADDLRGSV